MRKRKKKDGGNMNYNKLNPLWWFQNSDKPLAPSWYKPDWPEWRRQFYWKYFRNPLHNFTWYIIGIADDKYKKRIGTYPTTVFAPDGGWNLCYFKWPADSLSVIIFFILVSIVEYLLMDVYIIRTILLISNALLLFYLPFVSYNSKIIKFYIGWRNEGNFGGKIKLFSKEV